MTRLLVSVRDVGEALSAAAAGADFIDLKEPRAGALGGLPLQTLRDVVAALRDHVAAQPVSATIGDCTMAQCQTIVERVQAVAGCGVDYVKVGILDEPGAPTVLGALSGCSCAVVPVFIADRGVDPALLALACALPFPALMLDTADKQAGSLFDCMSDDALQRFIAQTRRAHRLAGLAGALRVEHLPRLLRLAPDFAGFRSAVCSGDRTTGLVAAKVQRLGRRLRETESATQETG